MDFDQTIQNKLEKEKFEQCFKKKCSLGCSFMQTELKTIDRIVSKIC